MKRNRRWTAWLACLLIIISVLAVPTALYAKTPPPTAPNDIYPVGVVEDVRWKRTGEGWGAADAAGVPVRNKWVRSNDGYYFIDFDGNMHTGWLEVADSAGGSAIFYAHPSGRIATGWNLIDGSWYLFGYFSGRMVQGGWMSELIDQPAADPSSPTGQKTVYYYLDQTGRMVTGWLKDGAWYYFSSNGVMAESTWLFDNGWYYLSGSGAMLESAWLLYGDGWYFLNQGGQMLAAGWANYDGGWYYFDEHGRMLTSTLLRYDGAWYYLKEDGRMAVSESVWIDGLEYPFDASGRYLADLPGAAQQPAEQDPSLAQELQALTESQAANSGLQPPELPEPPAPGETEPVQSDTMQPQSIDSAA